MGMKERMSDLARPCSCSSEVARFDLSVRVRPFMISRNDHRASTPSDEPFVTMLSGGDRRSNRQADHVAALATEPASFASL
jgi:hypothetical protein